MDSTVLLTYWNDGGIGVVATEGLNDSNLVVALAEYCRLVELKRGLETHSVARLLKVISNALFYMGIKDSCEVVCSEEVVADVEYVIYEKYLEPYGLAVDDSLIRIVADEFLLGVIDDAQLEEDRLGIEFIRANMSTHAEFDAEDLPF